VGILVFGRRTGAHREDCKFYTCHEKSCSFDCMVYIKVEYQLELVVKKNTIWMMKQLQQNQKLKRKEIAKNSDVQISSQKLGSNTMCF